MMEMLDRQMRGCTLMVIYPISEKHAVLLLGGKFRSNNGNKMVRGKLRGELICRE